MGRFLLKFAILALLFAGAELLAAQEMNPVAGGQPQDQQNAGQNTEQGPQGTYDNTPLYRIQVVGREIPAINYVHHSGKTEIAFQGTSLLPQATGDAFVQALNGRTSIHAHFDHLTPANSFGSEYLTYVLWAITPEGRPVNLGEVLPTGKKDRNEITVTTNLQAFGLIVTAEPYFAVTMPSDLVVAQNEVMSKTHGIVEQVNVHYSLLPRGAYEQTAGRRAVLHPITRDMRSPLELYEADNAVQIAEAGGANQYAADSMATAKNALNDAENTNKHKHDREQTITYAREAVQAAEDARLITIRKLREADEEANRQARAQAEQAATAAQQAAAQQAEERAAAEQAAEQAKQQADAAQQQQQQAEEATARARQEQMQAEQQAAAARQAQQQAEQNAQQLAQQAEEAREHLRQQLSQILQTRETARGLIMNMPNVLFAFNKYELKPEARVKLATISGILLAYPDLKVQVEGYTDNIGSAEYNQRLSEERAGSVRDFLVAQNVPATNVSSQGYGMNRPVADNTTSEGRAQNRRVQLVISGASIGIPTEGPNLQGQNGQPEQNPPPMQPQMPAATSGSPR